jgi:hypothetical protein
MKFAIFNNPNQNPNPTPGAPTTANITLLLSGPPMFEAVTALALVPARLFGQV